MNSIHYQDEWLERRADGLLRKPKSCIGCPGYDPDDPWGIVPDEYCPGAEVLFHYQNPGEYEEEGRRCVEPLGRYKWATEPDIPRPLIGPTGYEFDRNYLPLARLQRGKNVSVSNTLRCRFKGLDGRRSNNMPSGNLLYSATAHCTQAHFRPPESTRLVVAGGEHAWKHLTGDVPGTVSEWRGYTVQGFDLPGVQGQPPAERVEDGQGRTHRTCPLILATFHLALLGRDPKMIIPTKRDFAKIPGILQGKWPKPLPPCFRPRVVADVEKLYEWFEMAECTDWVVVDTEYLDDGSDFIYMIGIGYKDQAGMIHGIQLWRTKAEKEITAAFINRLWHLTKRVPMVCQNLVADVNAMEKNFRMGWDHYFLLHDTMQANTVLWSSWPDDLNFQASILCDYERTKHLQFTDPEKYNWGDVVHPIEIMEKHFAQFKKDPDSWRIYQENLRILPVVHRSMKEGLRVSDKRVRTAIPMYETRVRDSSFIAEAYAGWPFNPGSDDQCKIMLYDVEGIPKQRHPKTKRITTNKDAVGEMRKIFLGEIEDESPSIEAAMDNIEIGGHPILEAMYLHSRASHVLSAYLIPLVEK